MDNTVTDTKCYVVATNVRKFAMLQETALELIMQIDEPVGLYGKPLADNWVPMEVTWFYNPDERIKPQPDIAAFGSTAFAASAATCEQLRPHIQDYVEFLPINVDGWRWYIIHVLAREDVFNEQESRRFLRPDGTPSRMFEKLVLDGQRAKNGVLFRVTGLGLGIFTTDLPHSFKHIIRKLKLTGLTFQDMD
jgi:hypothetical protein